MAVDAVFKALPLRRGPPRWRPPGSACWRRACRWRCGRARAPWRGGCPGARRPPRRCCRWPAAPRPAGQQLNDLMLARREDAGAPAVALARLVTVAVAVAVPALRPAVAAHARGK